MGEKACVFFLKIGFCNQINWSCNPFAAAGPACGTAAGSPAGRAGAGAGLGRGSAHGHPHGQQNRHGLRIKQDLLSKCLCTSQAVWIGALVANSLPFKLKILLICTSLQLQFPSAAAVHSAAP